jgi:hypothetical protein
VFRTVGPGEQRVYGVFEAVECTGGDIILRVRTTDAVLRARTAEFQDVDFIAYRSSPDEVLPPMSVNCGDRPQPEDIYLTWRVSPDDPTSGTAVAVELLPEGYDPQR